MEYKFSGNITLDDFIRFNQFFLKETFLKGKRLLLLIVVIFIILIFGTIDMFDVIAQKKPFTSSLLLWEGLFLVIFFLVWKLRSKKNYKKYYDSNKSYPEMQDYTVNKDTINIVSKTSNIILTKDKINKIGYDRSSVYVFTGLNTAYIIKDRYFSGKTQFLSFRDFILTNFKPS